MFYPAVNQARVMLMLLAMGLIQFLAPAIALAIPTDMPIVTGPATSNSPRPTWTWSSPPMSPGIGVYQYQLNTGGWSLETTNTEFTPLEDLLEGPNTLYVQEKNGTGVWGPSGSWTTIIDLPPAAPVVTGPATWNAPYPTWTWTGGGGGNGTFRFKLDDSDLTSGATETTQTSIHSPSYIQFTSASDSRGGRNLSVPTGETWTAEAWVKADSVTGDHVILELQWSLDFGVNDGHLYYNGNGTLVQTPDAVITPGVWTHVALVKRSSPYLASFYVNGTCVYKDMKIGSGTGSMVIIGNDENGGRGWDGGIRDVRLWDHVRDSEQIRLGMHQPLEGTETGLLGWWLLDDFTVAPGQFISEDDGPNGYDLFWYDFYPLPALVTGLYLSGPLGETTHTLYVQERDEAGNWSESGSFEINVDMTAPPTPSVQGAAADTETTWTWQSGGADGNGTYRYRFLNNNFSQGYTETTTTELTLGLPAYLELTGQGVLETDVTYFDFDMGFTLSVWVKPVSLEGDQVICGIGNKEPGSDTTFLIHDGHLMMSYEGLDDDFLPLSVWVISDASLTAGEWQNIAAVYDAAESVGRLYLDGQLVAEDSFAAYGYLDMFFVGGEREGANTYIGGIRDMRVSLHADSQLQINADMWSTDGLASCDQSWMFDDMQGQQAAGTHSNLYFRTPNTGIWHGTRRGDVTMYVQERDNAGNWSETGEATATIDDVPPGKPVYTSSDPCTADFTYTWEWQSGGGGAGIYMCSLNGGPWFLVEGTSWTPTEDMLLGDNTFQVFEVDAAGNISQIAWRGMYVDPTWTVLEMTTDALPTAALNAGYSFQLEATGGTTPYTWYDQSQPYAVVPDTEQVVFPAGTAVVLADDWTYETHTLPWNFTFFGHTNNQVDVYTQGVDVPSVGWFWFNPYFDSTKTVTQLITADYAVFNFEMIPTGTTDVVRCEIILYPSGEVRFQDYTTYNGEYYFDWVGEGGYYDRQDAGLDPAFHLEATPTLTSLGLAVSPDGLITGTPNQVGEFTLAFSVEDFVEEKGLFRQSAEKEFTLKVVELPIPVMTAEPPFTGGTTNTVEWVCEDADQFQVQCAYETEFWNIYAESGWITGFSYEFTDLPGAVPFFYRVRSGLSSSPDAASEWSDPVSSTQDTYGPAGEFHLDNSCTNKATINVYIDADNPADVDAMSLYDSVSGPTDVWIPYSDTASMTLAGGDGLKTVYVALRNVFGNVYVLPGEECTLDTVAPVATVEIEDGATYTRSLWNFISVEGDDFSSGSGSGVAAMRINVTGTWSEWSASSGGSWVQQFPEGDGEKIVYVEFRDYAGNVGSASDSIIMDTTPPVITLLGDYEVTIEQGSEYTDAGATAWDNLDGDITDSIQVTNNVNTAVPDTYGVYYTVNDTAGNGPLESKVRWVTVVEPGEGEGEEGEGEEGEGEEGEGEEGEGEEGEGEEGEGEEGEGEEGEGEEGEGEEGEGEEGEGEEGEGEEGEGEEGEGEEIETDFYFNSFGSGATVYLSSSAGPVPLVFTVTAPDGTQSVTYTDDGTELTIEEPPYRFVSWPNVDSLAWGDHTFTITALLADNTEASEVIEFTLAPAPINSDLDANGIPDNPFELLNDGDLWLNLTWVHEVSSVRMTAVRRVEAGAAPDVVRTEVLNWESPDTTVTLAVPHHKFPEDKSAVIVLSTASNLFALLGDAVDTTAGDAPEGYLLAQDGTYTEASVLLSHNDVDYLELSAEVPDVDPITVQISLPFADPSLVVYSQHTEIDSDETGLYIKPLGSGWLFNGLGVADITGNVISGQLTVPAVFAPFVTEPAEGEGEGDEGEGEEGEGEGDDDAPPACFNTDKLADQARLDLVPLAIAVACLMLGQTIRGRRD